MTTTYAGQRKPEPTGRKEVNLNDVVLMCPEQEDTARQEDKDGADVQTILRRHGGLPPNIRIPMFGEVDYTTNLQDGLAATRAAKEAYETLPLEVRRRYPTLDMVQKALELGELKWETAEPGETAKKDVKPDAPKT